nr:transposase [Aurantimonas endophytica]
MTDLTARPERRPLALLWQYFAEARILIKSWRRHYNNVRRRSSIGKMPAVLEVYLSAFASV